MLFCMKAEGHYKTGHALQLHTTAQRHCTPGLGHSFQSYTKAQGHYTPGLGHSWQLHPKAQGHCTRTHTKVGQCLTSYTEAAEPDAVPGSVPEWDVRTPEGQIQMWGLAAETPPVSPP
jgi:hypothetical protein